MDSSKKRKMNERIVLNKLNVDEIQKPIQGTIILEENKLGIFLLSALGIGPLLIYLLGVLFFSLDFKLNFFLGLLILLSCVVVIIINDFTKSKVILNHYFILNNGTIIYWKDISGIFIYNKKSSNPRYRAKKYILIESIKGVDMEFRIEELNINTEKIIDLVQYFWSKSQ